MNWDRCQNNYPIKQVNVSNLENYLKDRGWIEEFRREEVIKFKSPRPFREDRYMEVFIPSQEDISQEDLFDYERTIEIAIDTISTFEGRKFEDVLSQILIFSDLLKFQISTSKTKKGSIPIEDGIKLYNSISNLLIYSACAEIKLQKSFLRTLKIAKDLIETVQIGQSEYGSFVANIQCELNRPRYLDQETNRRFIPLGRTTILRILKGIKHINESVQGNTAQPIINNYNEGFNANMCDTLIDIIDIGQNNDIIISANLEPSWEIPENIPTHAIITPYAKGFLQEASDELWGEEPEERHELKGYVFLLRSRPDEDQKLIRILASDESGENLVVEIEGLDAELYHLALNAHDNGKLIKIAGILKKIGKKWVLDNPEYLKIITE